MMIYGNLPWMEQTRPIVPTDSPIAQLVDRIWEEYFFDVIRCNTIMAGYDYPWKNRLGRIRMTLDGKRTEITLNGLSLKKCSLLSLDMKLSITLRDSVLLILVNIGMPMHME
jgi:hypothetical protein